MTNGEKLEQVFPDGICPFSQNWLKAEYKESTQKTCKTCKTCRNFGSHNGVCDVCNPRYNDLWREKESNKSEILTGSTTKDYLGVDAVSRQAINGYIDYILSHGMGKKKSFDFIKKFVANMSSVTPQKPRKGQWLRMSDLSEQEDDRYKCSCCGNVIHYTNKINLYTFNSWCGRCGSDNGIHIHCEVEE